MIFKRLTKPKWEHPNPKIRAEAAAEVSEGTEDGVIVLDALMRDSDPTVRRAAVKRISRLSLLRELMAEDPELNVREVAANRYRHLLAGGDQDLRLEQRLAELGALDDESVLAHVARRGREPDVRLAAVERLSAASLLVEVAMHDTSSRVRLTAVARIRDPEALNALAAQGRDHDRQVRKIAQEALAEIHRQREAEARDLAERDGLIAELKAVVESGRSDESEAHRARIENRWRHLGATDSSNYLERFNALIEQFDALPMQAEPKVPAKPERAPAGVGPEHVVQAVETLRSELTGDTQAAMARLDELGNRLAEAESHWETAEKAAEERLQARYEEAHHELKRFLTCADVLRHAEGAIEAALTAVGAAHDDPEALARTRRRLEALLTEVDWDLDLAHPPVLDRAYAALDEVRREREALLADRERRLEELERMIESCDHRIEEGLLRPAQKMLRRVRKSADAIPGILPKRMERHIRRLAARVAELRDWQGFATLPKREELCAAMESLAETELEPPEKAAQIKALQESWKELGPSDSPDAQALWHRFSEAADRAFEPCRAYYAEQEKVRDANLRRRREICDQLDEFLGRADLHALETGAIQRIRDQARQEWREASPVDQRAGNKLGARFKRLTERLNAEVEARFDTAAERRLALIRRVEAAADAEDLHHAIEEAKEAQAQWKDAGWLPRGRDQKLYRQFRKACDRVFARRDEAREHRQQERQQAVGEVETLLNRARELVDMAAGDLSGAERQFRELEQALREFRGLPKGVERDVGRALSEVRENLQRRRGELRAEREAEAARARARGIELVEGLERLAMQAETAPADSVDAMNDEWETFTAEHGEQGMTARWERARAAATGERPYTEDELAANAETRRQVMVRLEILAGLESPEKDSGLRMELQVARLAEGIQAGERKDPVSEARELVGQWAKTGPAGAQADPDWAARFEAARKVLFG